MCVLELMNGHVLQTLREQLKVPGSRLEGSERLTSEFLRFRSRLNETSGGLGKTGAVSGSVKKKLHKALCSVQFLASFTSFYFEILSYLACGEKRIRLASKNSVKLDQKSASDF